VVLLLSLHENDAKEKRKVLKAVSNFPGSFAPFLYPLRFFKKKNWTEFHCAVLFPVCFVQASPNMISALPLTTAT